MFIPHNLILTGRIVEHLLQQIAFGVKCSAHAVELTTDLAERMDQDGLKAMITLFQSKIRGGDRKPPEQPPAIEGEPAKPVKAGKGKKPSTTEVAPELPHDVAPQVVI